MRQEIPEGRIMAEWFVSLIALIPLFALSMQLADPSAKALGLAAALLGLLASTWGMCDDVQLGVLFPERQGIPMEEIDWGVSVIVRWLQLFTVATLVVYAVLPQVYISAVIGIVLSALLAFRFRPLCRKLVPRYYQWIGEGKVHHVQMRCGGK